VFELMDAMPALALVFVPLIGRTFVVANEMHDSVPESMSDIGVREGSDRGSRVRCPAALRIRVASALPLLFPSLRIFSSPLAILLSRRVRRRRRGASFL
jgi:hypothetical protein